MKKAPGHSASRHGAEWLLALACVGVCVGVSGCAAPVMVAAGPALGLAEYGTTTFVRGISTTVFAMEHEKVEEAVRGLIADLEFTIEAEREDKNTRYFRVEDDRGTEIKLWITRNTAKVTTLEIRVTFWGDEPYSSLILDQVKQRVGRG